MVNYKPTKKQIYLASENIVELKNNFCCSALYGAVQSNGYSSSMNEDIASNEFKDFYGSLKGELGFSWFGHRLEAKSEYNRIARSIALLLYAEARADVLPEYLAVKKKARKNKKRASKRSKYARK